MGFSLNKPIIIGLPRSRTAWLSVFMSQSGTYFHHEAINGCYSLDEYDEKTENNGDCTTGFSVLLDKLKGRNVVIIKKNNEEFESCVKWCDVTYGIDSREYLSTLNEMLNTIDGLVVNQSDIDSFLPEIWDHLVDDVWFEDYSEIKKLNIQVNNADINEVAVKALYATI